MSKVRLPPVYNLAYHLSLEILKQTSHFPKHYRPTIGRRLEEGSIELVIRLRVGILKKSSLETSKASDLVDELKVLIQIAHDTGVLSHHLFGTWVETLETLGKMIGGLLKIQNGKSISLSN
jgi:hypothetical protein